MRGEFRGYRLWVVMVVGSRSLAGMGRSMFEFKVEAQSEAARAGMLVLPHGAVATPVFMPVGTQGTALRSQ